MKLESKIFIYTYKKGHIRMKRKKKREEHWFSKITRVLLWHLYK